MGWQGLTSGAVKEKKSHPHHHPARLIYKLIDCVMLFVCVCTVLGAWESSLMAKGLPR